MKEKHINNFDLLRLLAAIQVVIIHGSEHLQVPLPPTLLMVLGWFPGVTIFFVISGYLITGSLIKNNDIYSYIRNRTLRIWPALWFSTGVSVVVLHFLGKLNAAWYSVAFWAISSATFAPFTPSFLKSWGTGSVNGSLWTIPLEIQFYIALPFLLTYLLKSRSRQVFIFLLTVLSGCFYLWLRSTQPGLATTKIAMYALPSWLYLFVTGVLLRLNWPFVSQYLEGRALHWLIGYLTAVFLAHFMGFTVSGNAASPLTTIPLAFLVIAAATSYKGCASWLLRDNDVSYGIYIYHMIIINIFVNYKLIGENTYLYIAIAGSVIAGTLSWLFIEKPALGLKRHFQTK